MKAYVSDFNNVLLELKNRVNFTSDPREADVFIIWQDVRGAMKTLVEMNADFMNKPVVVVQHGRGATRDYLAPNSFPLLADKICVWGEAEAERLKQAGYADKTVITGSPLTFYTRNAKLGPHKEKIVVYVPVITSHEEADNLEVFYELKKMEFDEAQALLREHKTALKKAWGAWVIDPLIATERTIPYDVLRKNFFLVSKLTDVHDHNLYTGVYIKTSPINIIHLENSIKVLQEADCVVGLEEGTFQLMATAMGIPTVIVDGFKYGDYGGVANYETEVIRSNATKFCALPELKQVIKEALNNKEAGQDARQEVVRREFDPFPDKDPIELIIDVASELAGGNIRKQKVEV